MTDPFDPFSLEHLLTTVAGFSAVAGFLYLGRRGGTAERTASASLAWLNLAAYPISLVSWILQGVELGPEECLPFHLCDVASITAGVALLTKHQIPATLTYFWGLAGTLQGLVTPAITAGFPGPACLTFFFQHFAIVAAALYLPLVKGWRPLRPLWKTVGEVFLWSIAYLLFAMAMNRLTGANFAYATRPPENPSLLDHLGPWPWYLVSMQGIALLLFTLLCLPFTKAGSPAGTHHADQTE